MLKYGLAALLAVGLVWLGSYLWPDLFGGYVIYLVAIVFSLLCVRMTGRVGKDNWGVAVVLLGIGALFAGFGQGWAAYVIVAGLGTLAGTLIVLAFGQGHSSPARA